MKRANGCWPAPALRASAALLAVLAFRPVAAADAAAQAVIDDPAEWTTGNGLYLDVVLNGVGTGRLAHFDERGGELYARAATLAALGFRLPPGVPDPVRLGGLAGVAVDYDAARQRVAITAPLALLDLATTPLGAPAAPAPKATRSPGLLLDYDVYGARGGDVGRLAATTELRAFGLGPGVLDTTALTRYERRPGDGWHAGSVRLDTSWQFVFPDSMLRLTVGDALTGALSWTRSTRLGGIGLGTDFGLQPYRVTMPTPAFFGQATLPSTVDLYVDGIRQYSGRVAPGPFRLDAVPTVNGAGSARIVVTDALGRSSALDLPLYGAHQLLAAGLADGSASLGVVREGYGLASFDYGREPVGSASLRYGVSDRFTAEGHAEGAAGLASAGAGGVWLLGTAGGVLSGSLARSAWRGRGGTQLGFGYGWTSRRVSVSLDGTRTRGDYLDVASLYGIAPPRVSERAVASYATRGGGSFGVNVLRQQYRGQPAARYAGAFWSGTWSGRLSFGLGLNQNLDERRDRSVFASLTFTPGRRRSYTVSAQSGRGSTSFAAQAVQPVPGDGGFGWRALAQGGAAGGGLAEAGWLGGGGQLTAGVDALGESRYGYADATGSLVLMGGRLFAARHVDDAFAVVSTDGIANVPVQLENRDIGRTGADGLLLVTRLNAYQRNRIAVDPLDLPANVRIDRVDAEVTPMDRSGAYVRFAMRRVRAATVTLTDAAGRPLALGSRVRIDGSGAEPALVGYDGAVYLDALEAHALLRVETPGGACAARIDYPEGAGEAIAAIGPVACRGEAP